MSATIVPSITTLAPEVIDTGYSGGTVFCILFFTACLLYFGGGIIVRKFLRGAEGQEMVPHYEFWSDLPNLIRDGIVFTLNGCQPELTYERI
jgi:cation-dependent mannose-6-phosphate receptor